VKNVQKIAGLAALTAAILALSGFGASASAEEKTEARAFNGGTVIGGGLKCCK
jgi:hypothetical protein